MARRKFDDVTAGEELPGRTVNLTRGDLVQYAGISGDENPIHWSESVVRKVGLDDIVAHGMLTMGIGGGYVSDWVNDPGAVVEYNVRFTSPVYVPDTEEGGAIEFTGKVKSVDEQDRTATIVITARSGGKKIFGRATAVVKLA